MQIQKIKLKNNLETLFIDNPGSNACSVQIWFRAGSALEETDNEGIAHFLEHMFFKGTKKRPGSKIAHEVESFGGEINAFTSFDYTCYYINCPKSKINISTEILLDMVSNPEFKQEELVPERGVVFEEFRRSLDNPNQYNFFKMQEQAFTNGYAHPILGNEKTIHNFTREQLTYFREKFYNLSNALLIIAGDMTNQDELKKIIEPFEIPAGPKSEFPKFKLKPKSSIKLHKKTVRMTTITISIQANPYVHAHTPAEKA